MRPLPSRRGVLIALACLTRQAFAQLPAKVSQATAKYQNTPRGGQTCEACTFFRRPRACQVVEGDISPDGWCQLFDMPD
jgi:hypothetical protein